MATVELILLTFCSGPVGAWQMVGATAYPTGNQSTGILIQPRFQQQVWPLTQFYSVCYWVKKLWI